MAKSKATRFESFWGGLVSLYQLDEDLRPVLLAGNIRFQNRVVGAKRNFCAQQAGHTVERLIRIPRVDLELQGAFAVINGRQYRVLQVQLIGDTVPQCTDLTLEQPDVLMDFDADQPGAGGRLL